MASSTLLNIFLSVFTLSLAVDAATTCKEDDATCEAPIHPNLLGSTSTITLNDGHKIPIVGLGTWVASRTERTRKYWSADELYSSDKHDDISKQSEQDSQDDEREELEFKNAIKTAIKAGYRHIDSAVVYRTEKVVGDALQELYASKEVNVRREDLWITTKVPRLYRDLQQVRDGIEESLKLLQTDYIDLYLIHSPHSDEPEGQRGRDVHEIYKILLEYQKQGKIRSVGVSNFGVAHLESLERAGLPLPSVNQIEASVFLVEEELIEYCKRKGIVIEAYSPIAQAHDIAKKNALLNELAEKYGKQRAEKNGGDDRGLSFAHIMIRWCIEKGFVVLPKSVNRKRIIANLDVFDFEIEPQDMQRLDALKQEQYRICWNPLHEPWDI